jgi:benzoyl-CoA reductase/2-hydroxyglutaryl-CoA dehydratase subunit BcrC/BadD/HgdB
MADLDGLLQRLRDTAGNPRKVLDGYLAQGRKAVGCFPVYVPEELVHAAGMVPMGLWGGQVTPTAAAKYNPIFTCSIMRSCLDFGMTDKYRGLSCVIMPMLCDTFRGMSSGWRAGVKDIPVASFIHPQNREDPGAREFLTEEYRALGARIEALTETKIEEGKLDASIEVYNRHSAAMMEFTETANLHLDVIDPIVRHAVMKSATFMLKEEHTALVEEIVAELKKLPQYDWKGKKVVITGITAEPDEFLRIFIENKIAVVGDDIAQESRQYRTPIPAGKDPWDRLARQWLNRQSCSTVHEAKFTRGEMLVDMARKTGAAGVVICLMRFCDVEEYDFPLIAKAAEAAGLRSLCLEIDQSTQNNEQSRTKLQGFAEMG